MYKCNVTNQFSSNKMQRISITMLVVMSRNSNDGNDDDSNNDDEDALLSKLLRSTYKIKSGDTLELFCVKNWKREKVRKKCQPLIIHKINEIFI